MKSRVPSLASHAGFGENSPWFTALQVSGTAESCATNTPPWVATQIESRSSTIPTTWLFENGEGFTPSGIAPATVVPSHRATPFVVPTHTVSP